MRFTIVYASATGHTEDIAERLKVLLPGSELKDLDRIDFTEELEESEALVCCTPTWNTGSESKRSCLLYTSPSPRDISGSRMPSSA